MTVEEFWDEKLFQDRLPINYYIYYTSAHQALGENFGKLFGTLWTFLVSKV